MTDEYREFYEHWRKSSVVHFPETFPSELHLKLGKNHQLPLNHSIPEGRIIVTKAFDDMFHRILRLRARDTGSQKGVVLTGQPGIGVSMTGSSPCTITHRHITFPGKTIFLYYMLVRLISARQPVLLYTSTTTIFFYRGEVYRQTTENHFWSIPIYQGGYFPLWALIDIDSRLEPPPIEGGSRVWPIQSSSPDPIRWYRWRSQTGAALLGMHLWTMEELIQGCVFTLCHFLPSIPAISSNRGSLLTVLCLCCSLSIQSRYEYFRGKLEQSLPLLDGLTLPTTNDDPIVAALKVLQSEREKEEEEEEEEDRGEKGDSIKTSAVAQDEIMGDQENRPQTSPKIVDEAFRILVRNATEEYGFAPRDVYEGVFDLPTIRDEYANVVQGLSYSDLKNIVETFSKNCHLGRSSHHVVAVSPSQSGPRLDKWTIQFKSIRIAEEVAVAMRKEEHKYLLETYSLLYKTPASSSMAGWIFESMVHCMLSGGSDLTPQPTLMTSDGGDPPTFSTGPSIPNAPPPLAMPHKTITQVDLKHELNNVTLEHNKYYIPTAANNPLFDSFTIYFPPDDSAVIHFYQITISPTHGGSKKGYILVRNIVDHVRQLLKAKYSIPKAKVEVAYVLVCPEGEHRWQMPTGWDEKAKISDHHGDAFCIRVAPHSMSCLFTPNFATNHHD